METRETWKAVIVLSTLCITTSLRAQDLSGKKWYGFWNPPVVMPTSSEFYNEGIASLAPNHKFSGRNCYAPSILESSSKTFIMWFGCQDKRGQDNILYTTSRTLKNWTEPIVVWNNEFSKLNNSGVPRAKPWHTNDASVVFDGSIYHMYYTEADTAVVNGVKLMMSSIGHATSSDGKKWQRQNSVLKPSRLDNWLGTTLARPSVIFVDNPLKPGKKRFEMWYNALCKADISELGENTSQSFSNPTGKCAITEDVPFVGYSTSEDGQKFTAPVRLLEKGGSRLPWIDAPEVKKINNQYWMLTVKMINGVPYASNPTLWKSNSPTKDWVEVEEIMPDVRAQLRAANHLFGAHNPGLLITKDGIHIFFGGIYESKGNSKLQANAVHMISTNPERTSDKSNATLGD